MGQELGGAEQTVRRIECAKVTTQKLHMRKFMCPVSNFAFSTKNIDTISPAKFLHLHRHLPPSILHPGQPRKFTPFVLKGNIETWPGASKSQQVTLQLQPTLTLSLLAVRFLKLEFSTSHIVSKSFYFRSLRTNCRPEFTAEPCTISFVLWSPLPGICTV